MALLSGPVGELRPADDPRDTDLVSRLVAAREHRMFAGRLDKPLLSFGERLLVTAMRAPVGDFRNWTAVADWADGIAAALSPERTVLRP